MTGAVDAAVAAAYRAEWGRVVATLIRTTGDWDLAEECAQDAFAAALASWPARGVPERPGAWLTTVARNRALDRLRRAGVAQARLADLAALVRPHDGGETVSDPGETDPGETAPGEAAPGEGFGDERLRLVFTCCHPALALEARVALTLRTLAGLTTAEIARAFLVPEATMAKRIARAKQKIRTAAIPYRVPPPGLLGERLRGVLAVLYLLFNEGYAASSGEQPVRARLCDEAIRLTTALCALMPREPEAAGLLALMRLHHARLKARTGTDGNLVTLEEQDRSLWDRSEIAAALEALERIDAASPPGSSGPYRLQARLAACHARSPRPEDTDWALIALLYAELAQLAPSPVVELNRAVAVGMAEGPAAGLALVDDLDRAGSLARYHLLHATRADLLRRLGRLGDAAVSYRRALEHATGAAERRFLQRRLGEVGDAGPAPELADPVAGGPTARH